MVLFSPFRPSGRVVGVTGGRADDQRRRGWDKGRPFIIILFLQISGCRLTRRWASRIWGAMGCGGDSGGGGGGICKGNRGRELEGCDLPAREFRLFRGPFVPNFDSDANPVPLLGFDREAAAG